MTSPRRPTLEYYRGDRSDLLSWLGGRYRSVLEIGCGAGGNASWLRAHGAERIVGIEIEPASAKQADAVFDLVIDRPVDVGLTSIEERFDLIVCADVLEHLVDPWSVVRRLGSVSNGTTVLAVSMPNIGFVGALARIAVGRGFEYQDEGIFDVTHLRFFTRRDMDRMLIENGWIPERWGARPFGRLLRLRRALSRLSGGRTDRWLAEQLYVAARPAGFRGS